MRPVSLSGERLRNFIPLYNKSVTDPRRSRFPLRHAALLGGGALLACAVPEPLLEAPPVIIAHRGASAYAPEHTFAAYDLAIAMGAHYLEPDLQRTADGILVALHDPTLDRTMRGPAALCTGPVSERTLAEIHECDAGISFNETFPERARPEYVGLRVPTLEEIIARYAARIGLYIETRVPADAPGMEEALVTLLRRHALTGDAAHEHRVIVQSFSEASLRRVHVLEPSLPLVQLFRRRHPSWFVRLRLHRVSRYAVGIGPAADRTTSGLIRAAQHRCLLVHPHTVNDSSRMARLLDAGANGLFTDMPDIMHRLLGSDAGAPFDVASAAADAVAMCRHGR